VQPAHAIRLVVAWVLAFGSALGLVSGSAVGPALVVAAALAPGHAQASPSALPTAEVRNVRETFFGTVVDDPYRYFEDTSLPEVAAWMKAHGDHARATLRSITGREALHRRLAELDASTPAVVANVTRLVGDLYVYEKRGAGDEQFKLYVRRGTAGAERLVFDPDRLRRATGRPHAINYASPSPDGRLVAIGVSADGSENASMQVLDMATGRPIGPEVPRVQFGAISWSPDSREIYFHRMQPVKPEAPETERYQRSSAVVMRPGAAVSTIRPVLTAGIDLGIAASEFPFIHVQPDGRVIATVTDGVSPDVQAWHTTLSQLRADRPVWTLLAGRSDRVTDLAVVRDRVYALTFRDAPRLRVVTAPLAGFSVARAADLLPAGERVLTGLTAAADGLYVDAREGNVRKLLRRPWVDDGAFSEVPLPVAGSFTVQASDPRLPGVLLDLQGWTQARRLVAVGADGRVVDTGLQPVGRHDRPDDITATEVMVTSHDGARVPMSIVHRKDVALDGRNPVLMWGYASYGLTEEPWFSLYRLAWMERGGVFVVVNPRGSGVFGQDWHDAGKQERKSNTWRDFLAAAEWLVREGWTRPQRLAIWGGSAGGILVGRAMTERPDLFAAVIPSVGALDMVRAETTSNGVPNIPEFGSRATEAGFRALLEMSTYHQIRDGVAYPSVLLTHGINDPRVDVWNSTKTAARLLAASRSGHPVLVRLDAQSGHGIGDTRSQILDETADIYAFLLWRLGVPGYEPR
jgi:prolyl oligopeptidase